MNPVRAPDVDMLLVSKSSRNQRKAITGVAPQIGLKIIDYGRLAEIDQFYIDCQDFRDFYRDPVNKLQKPIAFKRHYGICGRKLINKNTELLQLPVRLHRDHFIVYPVDYGQALRVGDPISLSGHYNTLSCIKYKR